MKQILCTLGPASMNERVIRRLEGCGATLFRINLSHTALEEVEPAVQFIKSTAMYRSALTPKELRSELVR